MARYPENLLLEAIPERFEVLDRLGSGAFGTVFRVYDHEYDTVVALKTLSQVDPSHLYHFKQEFRALADISHPNLIDFYELFALEDIWFFTMACIDGVDFKQAVIFGIQPSASPLSSTLDPPATLAGRASGAPRTPLRSDREPDGDPVARAETLDGCPPTPSPADGSPNIDQPPTLDSPAHAAQSRPDSRPAEPPDSAPSDSASLFPIDQDFLREVFAELVRGVIALHGHGMLHRDLKPGNVLVTADGRVVILDFGLVANIEGADPLDKRKGSDSDIVGTPRYLAPELVTEVPVAEASDWYAVGVMLYEVLTGRPPFIGQSTIQELFRKNSEPPTPITEYRPDVAPDLADICMDLLASDPGDRPDGRQLLERLGKPSPDSPPAGLRAVSLRAKASQPSGRPIFGRDAQLDRLRKVATRVATRSAGQSADRDRPAVVNVSGSSGVGKSTLVERFLRDVEARRDDALILKGRCYENESVPYKAFDGVVDAMLPHLEDIPDEQLRQWLGDDTHVHAISQLFPVLRQLDTIFLGNLEMGELSEAQLRNRGFEALGNLLSELAARHYLVIYIDDAQWGDEDSFLLLKSLLERDDLPRLMLVTTWRREDANASPFLVPFLRFLQGRADDLLVEDMQLEALDPEATRQLAKSLAAEEPEFDLDTIVRESRGHPFFVVELARHLHLSRRSRTEGPNPELTSLDDLLYTRIRQLPDHARTLLELIAVAGKPIESQWLREASNCAPQDLASLSLLHSERLIRRPGGDSAKLETYHDRVRETLLDQLDAPTVAGRHLALARALEASRHTAPETLAHHYEAAGRPQQAAEYMVTAAEAAADALAFERAVQLLSGAVDLGEWPQRRRFELYRRLGELLEALGLVDRSTEAYLHAAELGEGLDASECRIEACEQALRSGQLDRGIDLLYRELGTLGFTPTDSRPRMLASILYRSWRLQRRGYDHTPRPPRELDRRDKLLLDALTVATTMFGVIDVLRGAYFHYHALYRALDSGYPSRLVALLCQQAAQEAAGGEDPAEARRLLEMAESLLPKCRYERENLRAYRVFIGGMVDYFAGRWAPAAEAIDRAIEIIGSRCPGFVWETEIFQYFKFDCLQWLGQIATIKEKLPKELELSVERGDSFHSVLYRTKGAFLELTDGRPAEAERHLELARREWDHDHYSVQHFRILQGAVQTALYRDDTERARTLLTEDWGQLRRSLLLETEETRQSAWYLYGQTAVQLLATTGGLRAVKLGLQVKQTLRKLRDDAPDWSKGFADAIEARRADTRGHLKRAIRLLEQAERSFEAHGMQLHARSARLWRGKLDDGPEAEALEASARRWLNAQGVEDPDAMASTVVPF